MTTNEYTPTTENVRRTWLDAYPEEFRGQGGAAFNRWLATQTAAGDYHEGWEEGYKAGLAVAPDHQAEAPSEVDDPRRLLHEVNMLLSSVSSHGMSALMNYDDGDYTARLLARLGKVVERLAARPVVDDAAIVDALTAFYGEERDGWSVKKVRRMRAALAALGGDQ